MFWVLTVFRKGTINFLLKAYKVHVKFDIVPHTFLCFFPQNNHSKSLGFENVRCHKVNQFNHVIKLILINYTFMKIWLAMKILYPF